MKKSITIFLGIMIFCISFLNAEAPVLKFNAKDIYNNNVSNSVFQNSELTMINVWGTFCGPCINEMPDLGKLGQSYDSEKFQMIGIVIDAVNRKGQADPKIIETAKKIVKQTGADYIHIIPDSMLINGVLTEIYAVPTTFFVNKKGNLVGHVYTGSRNLEDWKSIVDSMIQK